MDELKAPRNTIGAIKLLFQNGTCLTAARTVHNDIVIKESIINRINNTNRFHKVESICGASLGYFSEDVTGIIDFTGPDAAEELKQDMLEKNDEDIISNIYRIKNFKDD